MGWALRLGPRNFDGLVETVGWSFGLRLSLEFINDCVRS